MTRFLLCLLLSLVTLTSLAQTETDEERQARERLEAMRQQYIQANPDDAPKPRTQQQISADQQAKKDELLKPRSGGSLQVTELGVGAKKKVKPSSGGGDGFDLNLPDMKNFKMPELGGGELPGIGSMPDIGSLMNMGNMQKMQGQLVQQLLKDNPFKRMDDATIRNIVKERTASTPAGKIIDRYPGIIDFFIDFLKDDRAFPMLISIAADQKRLKKLAITSVVILVFGFILNLMTGGKSLLKRIFFKIGIGFLTFSLSLAATYYFFQAELTPALSILVKHLIS